MMAPMKPSVLFRYDIQASSKQQHKALLGLYSAKFHRLMRSCNEANLSSSDYDDLPKLRKLVEKMPNLHSLPIAALQTLDSAQMRLLMDAAPMYNACSINVRSYVLLSLGIRSGHIDIKGPE